MARMTQALTELHIDGYTHDDGRCTSVWSSMTTCIAGRFDTSFIETWLAENPL